MIFWASSQSLENEFLITGESRTRSQLIDVNSSNRKTGAVETHRQREIGECVWPLGVIHLTMRPLLVRNSYVRVLKRTYAQGKTDGGSLPSHARVVICGGGVQGVAVSYYLAKSGWGKDVVLLDQGVIGGGSTWHMSGLVGIYK